MYGGCGNGSVLLMATRTKKNGTDQSRPADVHLLAVAAAIQQQEEEGRGARWQLRRCARRRCPVVRPAPCSCRRVGGCLPRDKQLRKQVNDGLGPVCLPDGKLKTVGGSSCGSLVLLPWGPNAAAGAREVVVPFDSGSTRAASATEQSIYLSDPLCARLVEQ